MGSSADKVVCRPNSSKFRWWQVWMSVGRPCGLSEESMGAVRRSARSRRWQAWAAKVSSCSERLESRLGADLEGMGNYLSLEGH